MVMDWSGASLCVCSGQLRGVDGGSTSARSRRTVVADRHRLSACHRSPPYIILAGSDTTQRRVTALASFRSNSDGRGRHRRVRRRVRRRRLVRGRRPTGGRCSPSHGRLQDHRRLLSDLSELRRNGRRQSLNSIRRLLTSLTSCRLRHERLCDDGTCLLRNCVMQQGVALTGRNRTGPPCSVGRPIPTSPAAGRPRARPVRSPAAFSRRVPTHPAGPHAGSVTDDNDSQQNTTGRLGGPVITEADDDTVCMRSYTSRPKMSVYQSAFGMTPSLR